MNRIPLFTFDNTASKLVERIPLNGNVHIIDSDGKNTSKFITVTDLTGLGSSIKTIADLLAATNQWKPMIPVGAPGATTLVDLTDTTIRRETDKDYLYFDDAAKKWTNKAPETIDLDDIANVNVVSPSTADKNYLSYDNATKKWIDRAPETINLDDIANVNANSPTTNELLAFDGTNWVSVAKIDLGTF